MRVKLPFYRKIYPYLIAEQYKNYFLASQINLGLLRLSANEVYGDLSMLNMRFGC